VTEKLQTESLPRSQRNPLALVSAIVANAVPCSFLQSEQWQCHIVGNGALHSHATAPQRQLPVVIARSALAHLAKRGRYAPTLSATRSQ